MATRTFPIEVTLANPGAEIRAGLSSEMKVPIGNEVVHLISPASLVLNDLGAVGVRLVGEDNRVSFMPVEIVDESPAGVLVKGLLFLRGCIDLYNRSLHDIQAAVGRIRRS